MSSPNSPHTVESGHTPGPWKWFGNANSNSLYLATTHSGRRYVMGFKRWGFSGAQPQFQPGNRGMVDASELLQFEVGDESVRGVEEARSDASVYRMDISGIDCADARLIAAAPDLLDALKETLADFKRWSEIRGGVGTYGPAISRIEAAIRRTTGEN